jgi:iron complex outermembrane recepter protein
VLDGPAEPAGVWKRWSGRRSSRLLLCVTGLLCWATTGRGADPDAGSQPAIPGAAATALPPVTVIGVSPLLGSGVDRNAVPAETHVLSSDDLRRTGVPDLTGSLQDQISGVALDSASGNQFQPTLLYHGFAASPLQGTPQGLAVYVNGVRFNQPFGDTVDWDLIPNIAIDKLNLEGSNPVFGLNALGGALNIQLKNGFTYQGFEADLSGGSFGQVLGEFQYGKQAGNTSTYVAGSVLHQDGWRDLQSSDLQNVYGDIGWRSDRAELHLNLTAAHSVLNGPGTSPVELLAAAPAAQFTAPNRISNQYAMVSLSGSVDISDALSVQTLAYYRYLLQRVTNGNAPNDTPCDELPGFLCNESGALSTGVGGTPIPDFLNGGQYGQLDNQTTNTNAYGASAQMTHTGSVLGRTNHLVAGLSFDGAQTMFTGASYVGGLTTLDRVFVGPGVLIDEPGVNAPVRVAISNATYGVYLADTLDLTQRLSLTMSGRFNAALVDLSDQNGGDLSGNHNYTRFNPAVGVTYRIASWLTGYAGYAEANRAPTPAELSCAGPANSCSLANFFVGDPDLKQVVSHTFEFGVRGTIATAEDAQLSYDLALFRSTLDDDIAFINSVAQGRAFFANIGQTRRQGVDAALRFRSARWRAYLAYSYIDATYQSGFVEAAGNNPEAGADGVLTVKPGNRLPGVPPHQLKFGAFYQVTDQWTVGATAIASAGTFLFGDEANLTARLPAWFQLNLSTTYQLTEHVQLFAWVQNVTNTSYDTFGTFSPTGTVFLAQAPGASNPRSTSPAAPIGGFGGIRISF